MDNLIISGEGFSYSVKEPQDWIADTDNAPKYESNIVFYNNEKELKNGGALIQVYAFSKQDENTIEDLKYDIASYKKQYPALKEQNFETSHKEYKTFSKLVYVDKKFFQYITYINPGDKFHKGISMAMHIENRPATENELAAYRQIVNSVIMLIGK